MEESNLEQVYNSIQQNAKKISKIKEELSDIVCRTTLPSLIYGNKFNEFHYLKTFLNSNYWPETARIGKKPTEYIMNNFLLPVENKRVLDFGCGNGWFVCECLKHAPSYMLGYDIKQHTWPDEKHYTDQWACVVNNKPYDTVLLWDVLDHVSNPVDTLKQIASLLNKNGKIYIHCHPWCGRNGAHANTNKAFVHLVFQPNELKELKIKITPTAKILDPMNDYERWFRKAELYVLRKGNVARQTVDKFFYTVPIVAKRIKKHWQDSQNKKLRIGLQRLPLDIKSVEYVLV